MLQASVRKISFITLIVIASSPAIPIDTLYRSFIADFDLLPEYYLKFDFNTFAFKKNTYFKQQYLAESNTALEFMFLSYRQFLYSVWDVKFKIGLGDIPGNHVFSVLNIHFNITPTLELRLKPVNIVAGIEHLCIHEVDRKNYPVIYWNAPLLAVGSSNMRVNRYWIPLAETGGWTIKNRLTWYIAYINFLKKGYGVVDPVKLNGCNSFTQEMRGDVRFAFYRRHSWIVTAHTIVKLGHYDATPNTIDKSGTYWREQIGFESYFRRGKRGAAFFLNGILDGMPTVQDLSIFSKDRLVEIGFSFFN
jgi:hypothetical protein